MHNEVPTQVSLWSLKKKLTVMRKEEEEGGEKERKKRMVFRNKTDGTEGQTLLSAIPRNGCLQKDL